LAGPEHRGEEVRQSAQQKAERIVQEELGKLGWGVSELAGRPKGDARKVRIAERLRRETTMTLAWIGHIYTWVLRVMSPGCCIGKRATKSKVRMRTVKISGSDPDKAPVIAALSLTPRFSGVWASGAALEPLQRFTGPRETAEAVAHRVRPNHPAEAGC